MRGIYVTACHTKSEFKKKKAKGYFKTFFLQFLINKYNFAHFFKKCFKASRATH